MSLGKKMEFEQLHLIYYFILFFAALFAGFIDSIVGGGGLITLPALIACGIPAHLCLATNKLQSVFGTLTASLTYFKSTTLPHLLWGIFFTALGAAMGSYAVLFVEEEKLTLIILFFLSLSLLYTILNPNLEKSRAKIKNVKFFHLICGLTLGFYDGFLGPGTGLFWILFCVILLGFDMKKASINTKILNFTSNIVALLVFLYQYELLWILGLLMGIGQILGAYLGSKLMFKINAKIIKILFIIVLGATIAKIAWDYLH